jgi:hypothetical protein
MSIDPEDDFEQNKATGQEWIAFVFFAIAIIIIARVVIGS